MFVIGAATVGFAASAVSAGAGVDGIRCEAPEDGIIVAPAQDGEFAELRAARGHEGRDGHAGAGAGAGNDVRRRGELRAGRT